MIIRREFVKGVCAASLGSVTGGCNTDNGEQKLYGLIGKMNIVPGKRDELIEILISGLSAMPGCLSYVVAKDPTDPDAIWVTEVWDGKASHEASLSLASVKEAISLGRPMISGFGERFETEPVGGHGLAGKAA